MLEKTGDILSDKALLNWLLLPNFAVRKSIRKELGGHETRAPAI